MPNAYKRKILVHVAVARPLALNILAKSPEPKSRAEPNTPLFLYLSQKQGWKGLDCGFERTKRNELKSQWSLLVVPIIHTEGTGEGKSEWLK